MQTQHLAPDIAEERLDWFTYDIQPDGTQICAIRPAGRPQAGIVLDRRASQLLQLLLSEIARDHIIPFPQTRQAVLKALRRAHDQHHLPTD
jgi:hypothetical protein